MIDISYTITGILEVRRDLQKIRLDTLHAEIAAILGDMGSDAATYPPELHGQRYRRTNRLHDEWISAQPQFDLQGETLLATLTNPIVYGPPVMGADEQRAAFAGRWRTTDTITAAWEDRVAARVEDVIGRLIGP